LLSFGSLIFFSLNLPNVRLFEENSLVFFRANRFSEFVFDHQNFKNYHLQNSFKNIEEQKLDSSLLKLIGNKTIDVYPWDYSYIAANKLNWQPRPVLHSYAAYSSWLDMKDSQHFSSDNAPEFILLEIDKKTDDIYGGTFESVDNRYLPNDEPQTLISILEHYESVHKNNRFILLKKRKLVQKLKVASGSKFNTRFGTVVELPYKPENSVLRIKAKLKKSTKGLFQSFLFKDQESFINYYMDNGDVYRYKIVPKNAADGIWINPFLMHPELDEKEASCVKISFESSDPSFYQNEITCEWVVYEAWLSKGTYLFNKTKSNTKTKFLEQMIVDKQFRVEAAGFSKSFQISVDSLIQLSSGKTLEIKSNFWSGASKDAVFVISVDDDNKKNLFWESFELQKFTIKKGLNPVNINKGFDNLEQFNGKKAVLSVYIWNKGSTALEAANFGISFWKK